MRGAALVLSGVLTVATVGVHSNALADSYEDKSAGMRALYTVGAVIANVVPIASAFVAPKCLPGYILCKLSFAGLSLLAAGESLAISGGADKEQPKAILHRGFSGDWFLTGRHVAGDATPEVYPEAPPPTETGKGGFTPPPI